MMNIDCRYDALLSDLVTLLQEALFRFITNQQVNLAKFKSYFIGTTKAMSKLEEQFHANRLKTTHLLSKLKSVCFSLQNSTKFELDPEVSVINSSKIRNNRKNAHSSLKSHSESKKHSQSNTLNVIGEEQQDLQKEGRQKDLRKRSGTAGVQRERMQSFTIDFQNGRPMTGQRVSGERIHYQRYGEDCRQTVMLISHQRPRKKLYDDLQKQVEKPETISENVIKLPQRRNLSQQRKSYKINKLF